MASIYEKSPHFVLEKTWDKKTQLPETYKLHSNDSCKQIKAEVHQNSGNLGVDFTVNKKSPTSKKGLRRSILTSLTPFGVENVLQDCLEAGCAQALLGANQPGECNR